MIGRIAAAALISLGIVTSGASAAEEPLKVLRHLAFVVTVDDLSSTATKVAGFDGASSGTATDSTGATSSKGTISVDVVGATADGGLVVDASEDGSGIRAPVLRFGITDANLFYDPNKPVTPEEKTLLHYLARDFVKAGDIAVGTTWVDDMHGSGVSDRTTYRVTAVDADAKTITLDVVGETVATGPHGYDAHTRGTITYDTGTLVPISLALATRTSIQAVGRLTTVDSKLTSILRDDSFRKH